MYRRLLPLILLLAGGAGTAPARAQNGQPITLARLQSERPSADLLWLSSTPERSAYPRSVLTLSSSLPEAGAVLTSIALGGALGLAIRKGRRRKL